MYNINNVDYLEFVRNIYKVTFRLYNQVIMNRSVHSLLPKVDYQFPQIVVEETDLKLCPIIEVTSHFV